MLAIEGQQLHNLFKTLNRVGGTYAAARTSLQRTIQEIKEFKGKTKPQKFRGDTQPLDNTQLRAVVKKFDKKLVIMLHITSEKLQVAIIQKDMDLCKNHPVAKSMELTDREV